LKDFFKFNLRHLSSDAAIAFQGTALARQAAALVASVILVKGALSQGEVGLYEEWFYLGAILTFLIISGVVQAFAASYVTNIGRSLIFQTYWILMSVLGAAALVIFFLSQTLIPFLCGVDEIPKLGKVMVFLVLHFGAALVPYYLLVLDRAKTLLTFGLCYFVGMVLAVALGVSKGSGLDPLLDALLWFAVLEHIYLVYLVSKEGALRFENSVAAKLIRRALPLAGYSFLGALGLLFDAWLVNHSFKDLEVFAIFRYGARELPGALALAGAFSAAMLPFFSSALRDGVVGEGALRLQRGSSRLMHAFMPLSILLMLLSPWLFTTIYNDAYLPSAELFNIYLLLMLVRWIFAHTILIALEEERLLLLISLVELVINVVLSIWWMRLFGLVGIAYATVVAYAFEKLMMVLFLKRRHQISASSYFQISWWGFYASLLIASFLVAKFFILP